MASEVGWEGWFVVSVLVVMFIVLLCDVVPADFAMLGALVTVMLAQVVTTAQGLEGFANSAVLTVAILYVVAAGVNATGALDYYFGKLLGSPKSLAVAQLRLCVPVAIVSAFLNNTPVVAVMIPIVQRWAQRIKVPVGHLFIPLSFASILGGCTTLVGTSTNLVIAGRYEQTFNSTLGLFDIGTVGVPALFSGLSYILIFTPLLLPGFATQEKRAKKALGLGSDSDGSHTGVTNGIGEDFTVACVVTPYSEAVGKAVDEAELRGLQGLFLTSVQRDGRVFNAVGPEFIIQEGDILFFTGLVDTFDEFCMRNGFKIITDANEEKHIASEFADLDDDEEEDYAATRDADSTLMERESGACVGPDGTPRSPSGIMLRPHRLSRNNTFDERIIRVVVRSGGHLEGRTAREVNFRKRYDAAILSLYRAGGTKTLHGNLGRQVLHVGDVLLLVTGNHFNIEDERTAADLKPYLADSVAVQHAYDAIETGEGGGAENGAAAVAEPPVDLGREFLIPMRVSTSSRLVGVRALDGQSVESAGLRGLPGVFLVAIEHAGGTIEHVVGPDAVLRASDILWFVGEREALGLLRRIPGLESPDAQAEKLNVATVNRRLVECVLSLRSKMVGKTVREARFRTQYEAAIIAVHRQGRRVLSKIGDIELRAGDVLILDTGPNFCARYKDDKNFLLVTEIHDSAPPRFDKFYIALVATLGMILIFLFASEYVTLFEPAVVAAGVMIAAGCITPERARAAVSWDVIVTIACAFGLSNAMENTGVAGALGEGLVQLAVITNTGFVGVLAFVYLAGFLLSIVIANNATALLLFPIAATSALDACPAGTDEDFCLRQSMYTLMLASSSSFASPYGYQTNTMVLGCGGYIFADFLRFGFPMQIVQWVASVAFVANLENWYISWLVTFVLCVCICVGRVLLDRRAAWRDAHTHQGLEPSSATPSKEMTPMGTAVAAVSAPGPLEGDDATSANRAAAAATHGGGDDDDDDLEAQDSGSASTESVATTKLAAA